MKYTATPFSRFLLSPISLLVVSLFALSACSGGGSGVSAEDAPETDLTGGSTGTDTQGDNTDTTSDTDVPPETDSEPPALASELGTQYPADRDNDDRPGMIVTGLNGESAQVVTAPWLVNTSLFRNASAEFGQETIALLQYPDDFSVSNHVLFFEERLDSCLIRTNEVIGGGNGGDGGSPPPTLSGGDAVTISDPAGVWLSIPATLEDDGQVVYVDSGTLTGALPDGAMLSIPGDEFPVVAGYPLYEPAPIIRILPVSGFFIDENTAYSWIPGRASGYMEIDFLAYDDNGDFQGFPITCYASDDGSFELTTAALQAVADSENNLEVRFSRVYSRIDVVDDIVFRQNVKLAE